MFFSARRVTFRGLICIALGLIGLAVVALGVTIWTLRQDTLREAKNDTANIASVLAEQTDRSVQAIDLVATEVRDRFESYGALEPDAYQRLLQSEATYDFLVERLSRLTQADVLALVDKDGQLANTARIWPAPPTNLVDRDYYLHARDSSGKKLFVSDLVVNRLTAERTLFFSKRIAGPKDEFLGLVLIGVKLGYFQHIYNSITSLRQQSFMLLRNNGTILVRHPDPDSRAGTQMPEGSPWYRTASKGGGGYTTTIGNEGGSELVAVRSLRGYPMVVNVAISEYAALENWRRRSMLIGFGTLLAVLCALFLLRALNGQFRQLARSEASLAEREAKLEEKTSELEHSNARVDAALNNMMQGLAMFNAATELVVCNRPYIEMYGLLPAIVKEGCPLRRILEHRAETGTFFDDPDAYIAQLLGAVRSGERHTKVVELPDGRTFCVTNKPTGDGGWVATHEDISARRRAEKELDRTQNFLNAVVENIPETLLVKDARNGRYAFVNRAGERWFGLARAEIIGKTTFQLLPADEADLIVMRDRQALRSGELIIEDHPGRLRDGRTRHVTSKRTAIRGKNGKPEYLLSVLEDVTERKQTETQIAHLALHDPLTDLPNRAAFTTRLDATLDRAVANSEKFAVLCIDLDRFKEINDLFGHATGDAVLLELSKRMQAIVGNAFLARLGGDEFTVIVTEGTQPAATTHLAERLVAAVSNDIENDGRMMRVGLSIGVAIFPTDGTDTATLLRNADAALYRAKAEGRGAIRFFEAEMDRMLHDRRALQNDLAVAVARDELMLYYQPQAKVSGQIIGFEALLRWDHPGRGFVPPDTFIPLAEESGLIIPIGEWVLREACREAASWRKPLQIAVNLSPIQFRQGDLAALVHSVLLETGLTPDRLVLEITEGALMDDFTRALSILRRIKALGVRIAMDDFGTGYSSLSYLQSFPFDKIKIDQTFISNLERNKQSAAIVRAVLGLAQRLNLCVVAEGVENKEQLAILRQEHCDEMQGYLIGRPAPIRDHAATVGHVVPEKIHRAASKIA